MNKFDWYGGFIKPRVENSPLGPQGYTRPQDTMGQPSPMRPDGGQTDDALQAILAMEGLAPGEKIRARKQAQINQLRDMALNGNARHWTGALAQGLAGGLSGYQQSRLDPEEQAAAEERRRIMERIGQGIY